MKTNRAFTLLEVILATMILGMIVLTLYRFLATNLNAIRFSTEFGEEREAVQAVVRLVESQLRAVRPRDAEAVSGQPFKFRNLPNDELTWKSTAGAGLFTTAATGEFLVTLTVQPVDARSNETELGVRRRKLDPLAVIDSTAPLRGTGDAAYYWVPLIRPMAAFEVRYFDRQLNAWQDTWKTPQRLPDLVRLRLWKRADEPPVEAVLAVPAARMQQ